MVITILVPLAAECTAIAEGLQIQLLRGDHALPVPFRYCCIWTAAVSALYCCDASAAIVA